ncbi:uncharacterized protein LOC122263554 isoform X2 [Penaeus japonicus]|uniref:uncharacterized protein LOC122263554 isoform X2 n=1 Tax=Penaeus japonicus TaxID=27405 RepID=UPI001C71616B|nr:uncharacterized protein LOC122263554 isoform X2 [Penaeus japonicus]
MFARGRHGCGSLPRLLVVLLSLLMAARVQPSPFAEFEGLPFASSFESHFVPKAPSPPGPPSAPSSSSSSSSSSSLSSSVAAARARSRSYPNRHDMDARMKVVYEASDYDEQAAAAAAVEAAVEALQEYDFPNTKALEAAGAPNYAPSQKASLDSTKNLQQILRSFPLVVGGHVPPPSSSSPYDVWRSFQEGVEGDPRPLGGSTGGGPAGAGAISQARLPELPFGEPRPKRVMCHFKICNLGRRRRARQSLPLQGWLS